MWKSVNENRRFLYPRSHSGLAGWPERRAPPTCCPPEFPTFPSAGGKLLLLVSTRLRTTLLCTTRVHVAQWAPIGATASDGQGFAICREFQQQSQKTQRPRRPKRNPQTCTSIHSHPHTSTAKHHDPRSLTHHYHSYQKTRTHWALTPILPQPTEQDKSRVSVRVKVGVVQSSTACQQCLCVCSKVPFLSEDTP